MAACRRLAANPQGAWGGQAGTSPVPHQYLTSIYIIIYYIIIIHALAHGVRRRAHALARGGAIHARQARSEQRHAAQAELAAARQVSGGVALSYITPEGSTQEVEVWGPRYASCRRQAARSCTATSGRFECHIYIYIYIYIIYAARGSTPLQLGPGTRERGSGSAAAAASGSGPWFSRFLSLRLAFGMIMIIMAIMLI